MAKYKLSDIFEGNYRVSQVYGANPAYYSQFGLNGHEGVDYATPVGVKVLAPFDGKILRDNDDFKNGAYGNFIVVWDPVQKVAVWHCHLSGNSVSIGQTVKRGQVLGNTGNSGNSSGPHLHENFVETDANGNRLNTGNGKQGFLNILDPSLVEWVPIGSSSGTTPNPTNPPSGLDPVIQRKASFFDRVWVAREGSTDTNKVTEQQVIDFISRMLRERDRAGEFDKCCISAFGQGVDSNQKRAEEVISKLKSGGLTDLQKTSISQIREAVKNL